VESVCAAAGDGPASATIEAIAVASKVFGLMDQ
jgi:hypothetical protein